MLKKIAIRATFFAVCAVFILSTGMIAEVCAETALDQQYYILYNETPNGDCRRDSNDDGTADHWGNNGTSTNYILNGLQYVSGSGTTNFGMYYIYSSSMFLDFEHYYFVSFDIDYIGSYNANTIYTYFGDSSPYLYSHSYGLESQHVSFVFNSGYYSGYFLGAFYLHSSTPGLTVSGEFGVGNFQLVDLTLALGPTFDDVDADYFDNYYMPDDYFNISYHSFYISSTRLVSTVGVPNLGANLDAVDYSTSVISQYGDNMDVSFIAVFDETPDDIPGYQVATEYIETNTVEISYKGITRKLHWKESDYNYNVLFLDASSGDTDMIKRILFGREVDINDYVKFTIEPAPWYATNAVIYLIISSKFLLNVNIESFLISYYNVQEANAALANNDLFINMRDANNVIVQPGLQYDMIESPLSNPYTYQLTEFGQSYTNVRSFQFIIRSQSADPAESDDNDYLYLYELGAFSSDNVFIPEEIESDVGLLWEQKVCEWYQIGCQLSNFGNETVSTIYYSLRIDDMVGAVQDIFNSVSAVYTILPTSIQAILIIVSGFMGVGLIFVIVNSIKGD